MQRDGRHDREQSCVPRHLQAELKSLLQRDREQRHHGPGANPIGGRPHILVQAPAHVANEQRDADGRRDEQQDPAFSRELQVVVVGLGVMVFEIVMLVEQRGNAVRVEAGSCQGKLRCDRSGVGPCAESIVSKRPLTEAAHQRIHTD